MFRFLYLFLTITLIPIANGQKLQFFNVKSKSLNFAQKLGIPSDSSVHELGAFRISKQITLKQYKEYLNSIKEDSLYSFYLSQLPKIDNQEKLTAKYLSSNEFDSQPVIGVSMDNACNYAHWYTTNQKNEKLKYRLPTLVEWISMDEEKKDVSHGFLLDWTLNAYDESSFLLHKKGEFTLGYFYQHKPTDVKVKKRKCVIGKSFRVSLADPVKIASQFPCYADEGYADVGFRLVEVGVRDSAFSQNNIVKRKIQDDILLSTPLSSNKSLTVSYGNLVYNEVELNGKIIEYYTRNGQLEGPFNVFTWVNNQKIQVVNGEMRNNCRIGYWTIFDEKDPNAILVKRLYHGYLDFDQVIPKTSSNDLITFVQKELNPSPGLDKDGCRIYTPVKERDLIFSSRQYRQLLFDQNNLPDSRMVEVIKSALSKKDVISYDNSQFSKVSEEDRLNSFNGEIIGFRIKEDFFFDKNRKLSETRILGLAPIYRDSVENVVKEICWFYFPQVRKHFVTINSLESGSNLDNLFLDRKFFASVYSTGQEKLNKNEKELAYTDIKLLLFEHEIWLYLEGLRKDDVFDR
ncbi:MAG: SUMF1/EgtB/PvdO family nonheme iron enzyme [Flavobacteriales bacterium]|jgi:hypothetical protein